MINNTHPLDLYLSISLIMGLANLIQAWSVDVSDLVVLLQAGLL